MKGWIWCVVALAACNRCCDPAPEVIPAECVARGDFPGYDPNLAQDDLEPNDGLALAVVPDPGSTCSTLVQKGTLAGPLDIDVFRTSCGRPIGNTQFAGTAHLQTADPDMRACIFFGCGIGIPHVFACSEKAKQCDSTTTSSVTASNTDDPDEGFMGCCRVGTGDVSGEVECHGIRKQTVTMYLWIDSGSGNDPRAQPYSASYSVTASSY